MALDLGYDELRSASVEVPSAVLVSRLLDGGWRGPAASAFALAWEEWQEGLASVRASLAVLSSGLATTEVTATRVDLSSADDLSRLRGRLG